MLRTIFESMAEHPVASECQPWLAKNDDVCAESPFTLSFPTFTRWVPPNIKCLALSHREHVPIYRIQKILSNQSILTKKIQPTNLSVQTLKKILQN